MQKTLYVPDHIVQKRKEEKQQNANKAYVDANTKVRSFPFRKTLA